MKARDLLFIMLSIVFVSCTKPADYGEVTINIGYSVNGKKLVTDTLCYKNEAGNEFMITEIQWFLSRIELQDEHDDWLRLDHKEVESLFDYTTDWVFYVDTDIPENQVLETAPVPVGNYKTLRFVFGLNEEDNQTGVFTNPPESDMFWPDILGGGYHYMKLNGKFVNEDGQLSPLAIHLGIGQNDNYTEFYQNYFIVELPIDFTITENTENQLNLTMVVDNWFRNPNTIDFNEYGNGIMQNQTAQRLLKENGENVFMIGKPTENQNDIAMENENNLGERFRNVMQKASPKPHFWSWESVRERVKKLRVES